MINKKMVLSFLLSSSMIFPTSFPMVSAAESQQTNVIPKSDDADSINKIEVPEETTEPKIPKANAKPKLIMKAAKGSTASARTAPTVSVDKTNLDKINQEFTYTITQKMPENKSGYQALSDFSFYDEIDNNLTIDSVKVLKDGQDISGKFSIYVNDYNVNTGKLEDEEASYDDEEWNDSLSDTSDGSDEQINNVVGQFVSACATDSTLKNGSLFGNGKSSDIQLQIKVKYIDNYTYRLQDVITTSQGHTIVGNIYNYTDKNNTFLQVWNDALVDISWDGQSKDWNKRKMTNTVNTTVNIPKIPSPTKTVKDEDEENASNTLTNADEKFVYHITQKIPAGTGTMFKYSFFSLSDQIDPCLTIDDKNVKVLVNGEDKTDLFSVVVDQHNNGVNAPKPDAGEDIMDEGLTEPDTMADYSTDDDDFDSSTEDPAEDDTSDTDDGDDWDADGYEDSSDGSTESTETTETSESTTETSESATETTETTENDTKSEEFSEGLENDEADSVVIEEQDDSNMVSNLDDMEKEAGNHYVVGTDQPNHVSATATTDLLMGGAGNLLYGGTNLKETTVTLEIPVSIDSLGNEGGFDAGNQKKLEELRTHNHISKNADGTESVISFSNEAKEVVDDMIASTPGEVKTNSVTTKVDCPQLPNPIKSVTDNDDIDFAHTIGKKNENDYDRNRSKNRLSDSMRTWTYHITQDIPAHTSPLFFYKNFYIQDNVDPCLFYDADNIRILLRKNGEEKWANVTKYFTIEKTKDNRFRATAKDELLKKKAFYGNKVGAELVVSFPVRIHRSLDDKIYVTKTLKSDHHLIPDAKGDNVYSFLNGGDQTIDKCNSLLIVKNTVNQEGYPTAVERQTNQTETQLEVSEPQITKKADRFEWEVGEKVKYTLTVTDKNPNAIMDQVTVKDTDLPDSLQLDPKDKDSILIYARKASINVSAPGDETEVANPRSILTNVLVAEGKLHSAITRETIDAYTDMNITKQCEVEFLNDKGDTGDGFKVMIPKQYRGEEIVITFYATAKEDWSNCEYRKTCTNGSVVENTASVYSSLMKEDEPLEDSERVWINTPHLYVKTVHGNWTYSNGKFVEKSQNTTNYDASKPIHYSMLVQNEHPGTIAKDLKFTDKLVSDDAMIDASSVEVYKIYKNSKGQLAKIKVTDQIPSEDVQIGLDGKDLSIRTKFSLKYDGKTPFASEIKDNVESRGLELGTTEDTKIPGIGRINPEVNEGESVWKQFPATYTIANKEGKDTSDEWVSFRTVKNHPEEWKNAEIAYIVEYDANRIKSTENSPMVQNLSSAKAENAEEEFDSSTVTTKGAVLHIEESTDKSSYHAGDTVVHTIKVTNLTDGTKAKNVAIKGNLDSHETLKNLKVEYFSNKNGEGKDITKDCKIEENFSIETKKDIDENGMIQVVYTTTLSGDKDSNYSVSSSVAAKADNAYPEIDEQSDFVSMDGISARALSVPYSGVSVKEGDRIVYTIEVRNDGSEDKKNVVISDLLPNGLSEIVASFDKNGGTASVDGQNITATIPILHGYETKTLRISAKVGKSKETIINTPKLGESVIATISHPFGYWSTGSSSFSVVPMPITKEDVKEAVQTAIEEEKQKAATEKAAKEAAGVQILIAKAKAKGKTKEKITWNNIKGADGYIVYFGKCNRRGFRKVKTTKKRTYTKKKLKKGNVYKFYVVAYKVDANGKRRVFKKSPTIHTIAGNINKKYANTKVIHTKGLQSLSVGQKIKPTVYQFSYEKKKKLLYKRHTKKVRFYSEHPEIIKVKGNKLIAKKSGQTKIYVVAPNGYHQKITINVK